MPKKTLKVAEALIQVKGNQAKLLASCQKICNSYNPTDEYKNRDMGHSRNEYRNTYIYSNKEVIKRHLSTSWIPLVKTVVQVDRRIIKYDSKGKGKTVSIETSYYVSNVTLTAKQSYQMIRKHWWIENKVHYVKDVSMVEDKSRIRVNAQNMIILRDIGLNLIRKNISSKEYVKNELISNCMNLSRVLAYRGLF